MLITERCPGPIVKPLPTLPRTPRRRGRIELLARATDAAGRRQPDRVPFNCEGYLFWAVARHPVTISA